MVQPCWYHFMISAYRADWTDKIRNKKLITLRLAETYGERELRCPIFPHIYIYFIPFMYFLLPSEPLLSCPPPLYLILKYGITLVAIHVLQTAIDDGKHFSLTRWLVSVWHTAIIKRKLERWDWWGT